MLSSMTGFGRARIQTCCGAINLEMRTLNHRFLDLKTRMPRQASPLEEQVRAYLSKVFSRGRIELRADVEREGEEMVMPNGELLCAYYRELSRLSDQYDLPREVELSALLRLPGVFTEPRKDQVIPWDEFAPALEEACEAVLSMRREEGEALTEAVKGIVGEILEIHKELSSKQENLLSASKEKLTERLKLLADLPLDEGRLEQEVAYIAERSDIREELDRLSHHLSRFGEVAGGDSPCGRELDFILQEMNREANTIASKASGVDISQLALNARVKIEQLREQVQNIE